MTDKTHLQLHRRGFAFAVVSAIAFSEIAFALYKLHRANALLADDVDELYQLAYAATLDGARHPSTGLDSGRSRSATDDHARPRSGRVD